MGELKNCLKCGRMFSSISGEKYCSRCMSDDKDEYKVVREYIYDNPDAHISEVSDETGVSERKILKFLKEGKLELKGEGVGYPCASCGKSIKSGKFCVECQTELKKEFKEAFALDKKKEVSKTTKKINNPRMYTAEKK